MTIEAIVENGQIVLPASVQLPDGTKVTVLLPNHDTTEAATQSIPPRSDRLRRSAGTAELVEDAAHNVDHYLYGKAKK